VLSLFAIGIQLIVIENQQPDPNARWTDACFVGDLNTTATYPAEDLIPIGQSTTNRYLNYTVTQPASTYKSIANSRAHGVFLIIQIKLQSASSPYAMFNSSNFQLVDSTGTPTCPAQYTTALASIPYVRSRGRDLEFPIDLTLSWNSPPVTLVLAFDIDPNRVKGSYLLVWLTTSNTYSFDIGM